MRLCGLLAFLVAAGLSAQEVRDTIGPLEKQANQVTPENPIPRRNFSVAPRYPAEASAIDATGAVSFVVTIDDAGRVAELRTARDPLVINARPAGANSLRTAAEALVRESAAALRRWTYDPPAKGPLAFSITFSFRPGTEAMSTQSASISPTSSPSDETALSNVGSAPGTAGPRLVRVGSVLWAPTRVKMVQPIYPPEARAAHVSGLVIVELNIGVDGKVREAKVLRSVPLLDQAALDAVRQWEYEPTMFNGAPIPVILTASVTFTPN